MITPSSQRRSTPQFASMKLKPAAACCNGQCSKDTLTPSSVPVDSRLSWWVAGMDCAACARKVENAVRQLPEVRQVQVVFATEKLLVDAPDAARGAIEQAVRNAGYQLQDCQTATPASEEKPAFWREYGLMVLLALLMVLSLALATYYPAAGRLAFSATTLVGLFPVLRQALRLMRSGSWFAIETLMSVAAIGALIIGASSEAAMVLLLFLTGERLEGWAASRARRGVSALMALRPESAVRLRNGIRETVTPGALRPGDIIEVAAGGRLPADGRLLSPGASFNESALTGESLPVERRAGERVAAGATSVDRLVMLEVVSEPGDSAIDRILRLIEEAEERRAPVERYIDRFSRVYTPVIMALALLTVLLPPLLFAASWQEWIYKGLALLLIGCPCALVISTPAAITSGLAAAARRGALIKGGAALENLSRVRQVAFDKTGTLTLGQPQVTSITPAATMDENQLLALAAAVELGSTHPLALAIVNAARQRGLDLPAVQDQHTLAGSGISARLDNDHIAIRAPQALPETLLDTHWRQRIDQQQQQGQTVVVVTRDDCLLGTLALRDSLRPDASDAIRALQQLGITGIMLTGDNPRAAAAIANPLGLNFRASLLPADKVAAVDALNAHAPLAMVGDGINDAPAMKAATIGIAMGSGTDVALESADAALTHNRLTGLAEMIALARATRRNIRQNLAIALGLKGIFLVTTLLGITGLWLAVLADTGATVLVTANALRLLRRGRE